MKKRALFLIAALAVTPLSASADVITGWSFTTTAAAGDNSPAPTTGTGTATTLGMGTGSGGYTGHTADTASDDVLATAGTAVPAFTEDTRRIRGAPNNGWATHAAGAPQYSQGLELDTSTAGFQNIQFSFDWYSTTQGIRDLQFQYNTNINNAAGWTNFGGTSPTGTYIAVPNDYYGATSTPSANSHSPIVVDLSSIAGANNDPNFGIRLVSAFDSTGNLGSEFAGASLSGGATQIYNNNSGNWRFDNLIFSGTPAPEPASLSLMAAGTMALAARRCRRA